MTDLELDFVGRSARSEESLDGALQLREEWVAWFQQSPSHGGFTKWGYPKMDDLLENPIKIDDDWGYPHFRKPSHE